MYNLEVDRYLNSSRSVELPGLGTKVQLPPSVYLYVKGEVEGDLLAYDAELTLRLNGTIADARNGIEKIMNIPWDYLMKRIALGKMKEIFTDDEGSLGHCFEHKLPEPHRSSRLFVISKKSGLEHNMSLFADGHESGEFLQKVGYQDFLQKALETEGVKIDVSQYKGEDFADLAGFLALLKAKKAGDDTIRIPFFRSNAENREKMGRLFGFEPFEDTSKK